MFAAASVPISVATGAAVDFARMATGRSALQRAVDSAALSGAAAYVLYAQGDTFNAVALTVGTSAFCNATTAMPAGFTITSGSGSRSCGSAQGPAISAVIAGFAPGRRGVVSGSGCSKTNTVVAGATCGFVVTASTSARMDTILPFLSGPTITISATASAANPFINLGTAIKPSLKGSATYANSLWVYPLLLDANGNPDFSTNSGALPDTSACTGAPTQTSCGSYSMIASTKYSACTDSAPCTVGSTVFAGTGGVVQNLSAGGSIITATTPLGFAFETTGGGNSSYGYDGSTPPNGCVWPRILTYNTLTQVYNAAGAPLLVDPGGYWTLPTHWFYSSYLANDRPPSQREIALQLNAAINPGNGRPYSNQDVPSVTKIVNGVDTPATCPNASAPANHRYFPTTFPASGNTNCSLYIVRDPASLVPDPSLKVGFGQAGSCFTPANTPGQQYAALSCQSFAGHSFVFFWNDIGGGSFDDTDYGNGTLQVGCSGPSSVVLIN